MKEINLPIINVLDRLPKENQIVLAIFPSLIRQCYLCEGKWYHFQNLGNLDGLIFPKVTHWIELPSYEDLKDKL